MDAAGLLKKTIERAQGLGKRSAKASGPRLESGYSPVAIDFGVSGLKVAQLHGGDRVSALAFAPTADEHRENAALRLAWQGDVLRSWVKNGVFKGKRAVCGLPSSIVTVRHLQVESIPGLDPTASARHSMAEHLGCGDSQIVHRCIEVGPVLAGTTSGGSQRKEMISIAALRSSVEGLVEVLRSAGLDPVGMHAPALALARVFGSVGEGSAPVMVVDLGSQQTTAVVVDEMKPTVIRQFPVGGDTIDAAIAKELGVAVGAVRRIRSSSGTLSTSKIEQQLSDQASASSQLTSDIAPTARKGSGCPARTIVDDLSEELAVALRYHRGLFPGRGVRRVVFTGGGASAMEVCRAIAEQLGLAAQVGDPIAAMPRADDVRCEGVDVADATPGWAVSAGLAMSPTDL